MVMQISDVLVGQPIVRPEWGSFDNTIAGLVEHVVACGRLPGTLAVQAVQRIREREMIASTAMVDIGVSIPHARLDAIDGIAAAIAVAPTAVYQLADGLPISIVVLVLSSTALSGEHLQVLSSVSLLLQSEQIRLQLRNAATPQDVLRLVRSSEGRGPASLR
jgi:mannitol/fructose-specific phosphotransferase system IIA component (Ntr-type)